MIIFKDIHTIIGCFVYNVVLCCPMNQYLKIQINQLTKSHKNLLLENLKINMFKMHNRQDNSNMPKLMKEKINVPD